MLHIKDLKTLRKITHNNKKDELAIVEETRTIYKWDGSNWRVHKAKNGANVTLYELNQIAITSLPALTKEQIAEKKEIIKTYLNPIDHEYYMLLNNELKYYTLFEIGLDLPIFSAPEDEIMDCLLALGDLKDVYLNEQNAVECWVTKENQSYLYLLFEYDEGVIKCR